MISILQALLSMPVVPVGLEAKYHSMSIRDFCHPLHSHAFGGCQSLQMRLLPLLKRILRKNEREWWLLHETAIKPHYLLSPGHSGLAAIFCPAAGWIIASRA